LVKVIPCEFSYLDVSIGRSQELIAKLDFTDTFYPNTGDINSAFVEPRATDVPTGSQTPAATAESSEKTDDPELEKKKLQSEAAAREVEIQVAEAPLAKRQEELDRQEAEGTEGDIVDDVKMLDGKADEVPHHKRAALVDNDRELRRIDKVSRIAS
jgi:hypothetical protein